MAKWYRFKTKAEAEACLNFINGNSKLPITGRNSKTGELAESKTKTLKWAEIYDCKDGKFGFPVLKQWYINALMISLVDITQLETTYKPAIEEYSNDWEQDDIYPYVSSPPAPEPEPKPIIDDGAD